jgi:hypothetical protein
MESWENAEHDTPEICATAGALKISVGTSALTRNDDSWSKTVKQTTRVSAYPLALWLASSWWRLRWEPLPIGRSASASWRLSHEIAAAGYGYLWPRIAFACDGENVQIWSAPTSAESEQPIQYLAHRHYAVSADDFVGAVDSFMDSVLNRLDAVDLGKTELSALWNEVQDERNDSVAAEFRRIEAMLGFDADEIGHEVTERFVDLGKAIGSKALGEIASACSSSDPVAQLANVIQVADLAGVTGKFVVPDIIENDADKRKEAPWVRGQSLAQHLRGALGLNGQAIDDRELAALAEVDSNSAFGNVGSGRRLPLGIGVRGDGDTVKIVLHKRNRVARRFEFVRLVCDQIISNADDKWLPVTDTKTIRQKWQRSFAAEFLCPIDSLLSRLDDDFSEDAVEDAAHHYGVSGLTVTSQLVNHGFLPNYVLAETGNSGQFPYQI